MIHHNYEGLGTFSPADKCIAATGELQPQCYSYMQSKQGHFRVEPFNFVTLVSQIELRDGLTAVR